MGFIINPYQFGVAFTGLLDTYSGAAAAYSAARRLSSTYTGALIRVRRSSDNAEQDIGYNGSNVLDESALTTFVGANDGFITTLYDQSGNSVNTTQTTAANQPKIVSSGTVNKVNSKPAFTFNGTSSSMTFGSNPFYNKNTYSMFAVAKYNSTNAWYNMIISNSDFDIEIRRAAAQDYMQFIMGGTSGTAPTSSIAINNLQRIFAFYRNSNVEAKAYINNTLDGTITPNSNNIANTTLYLGSRGGSSLNFDGNMQEIIIYGSSQSANLSGINGNINTFYSIY